MFFFCCEEGHYNHRQLFPTCTTSRNLRVLIEMDPSPNKIRLLSFDFQVREGVQQSIHAVESHQLPFLGHRHQPDLTLVDGFSRRLEKAWTQTSKLLEIICKVRFLGKVQRKQQEVGFTTWKFQFFGGLQRFRIETCLFFQFPVSTPFFSWSEVLGRVGFFGTCVETCLLLLSKEMGTSRTPRTFRNSKFFFLKRRNGR